MVNPKPLIFVSSTIDDLKAERQAALEAINKLKCVPRMSEFTFEAVNKHSIQACIDEVKACDFYILLIGGRYGWELPNGISITEFEFDTAYKERKPMFVFNLPYDKEEKQAVFEKKVGNLIYYKKIADALELEAEIIRAINKYFEELQYEKTIQTEPLYSDLLEVFPPRKLYRAVLNIDRKKVILNSKSTTRPLKMTANARQVIYGALKQNSVPAISDWTSTENIILTFQDLHDSGNPLRTIVDVGTIEVDEAEDYYNANDDCMNIFKSLLHQCLVRKLLGLNIRWQHEVGLFYYAPSETLEKRVISWHSKVDASRTVFEAKYKNNKPEEILNAKHFAFKSRFFFFEGKWYLGLFPEWFFSFDGERKNRFSFKNVVWLKKKERNAQVFNHLKFIVFTLKHYTLTDLFKPQIPYDILKFGNLLEFTTYPAINDELWRPKEEKNNFVVPFDTEIPLTVNSDE